MQGILAGGVQELRALTRGEDVVTQGAAFGDAEQDTEIGADKVLGEYFARALEECPEIGRISVEGAPDVEIGGGRLWACVDPLDGSLNYRLQGATRGLPFAGCITFLDQREDARFRDVMAAGVVDFRNGDLWLASRDGAGLYSAWVNGNPARTLDATAADIRSTIVIGEAYYPGNRQRMVQAFAGEAGYLRSVGSAAYEMALVSSGGISAYFCSTQKQHELGAGFALTLGAGGVAWDFSGRPLADLPFDFVSKTSVILAANGAVGKDILRRLERSD